MVTFSSIGHVALRTRDIERSIAFYTEKLGCAEMMRLRYDDGSLFLVYLRVTDTQYLELFPYGVGENTPGRDVVAINHLCLTVENIEKTIAELALAGVPLTREMRRAADGNRQAWIEDPDGTRIEMMEMAPAAMQTEAVRRLREGLGGISVVTDAVRPATFV